MIPKTLTIIQRQILINQFKILSKLEDDSGYYEKRAEILENGYTGLYDEIFLFKQEEIDYNICKETFDILNMFKNISNSIMELTDEQSKLLDLNKLIFKGFNINNNKHYEYMNFIIMGHGLNTRK